MMGIGEGWSETAERRNDFQLTWQAVLFTGWVWSQTVVSVGVVPRNKSLISYLIAPFCSASVFLSCSFLWYLFSPSTECTWNNNWLHRVPGGGRWYYQGRGRCRCKHNKPNLQPQNRYFSRYYVCLEELDKEGRKYILQCFKPFCFIVWLLFCFLGYKGSVRECLKLFCLLIHVTGWHVFLQQRKPIILGFCFIKPFYRTSLGLKGKTSLNEILTSLKLVRYFRHHFE